MVGHPFPTSSIPPRRRAPTIRGIRVSLHVQQSLGRGVGVVPQVVAKLTMQQVTTSLIFRGVDRRIMVKFGFPKILRFRCFGLGISKCPTAIPRQGIFFSRFNLRYRKLRKQVNEHRIFTRRRLVRTMFAGRPIVTRNFRQLKRKLKSRRNRSTGPTGNQATRQRIKRMRLNMKI